MNIINRINEWIQYKISERQANSERKDPILKIHKKYLDPDFMEKNR